jgi:uridylate kinase
MTLLDEQTMILSVGGSLVVPNGGPDAASIKELQTVVLREVEKGKRLVIVVGGGKTARHYIEAAKAVGEINPEDLDWLGIHSTRLNAHLLRTVFREIAHPVVIKNPTKVPKDWKGSVLLIGGWKPGWSTDYVACRMATELGVKQVFNFSNIDHVYDKDPNVHADATPIKEISWKDYRAMVGDVWTPGMSAPFDPIASKYCDEHGLRVAIAAWEKENVDHVLSGKEFTGTVIA